MYFMSAHARINANGSQWYGYLEITEDDLSSFWHATYVLDSGSVKALHQSCTLVSIHCCMLVYGRVDPYTSVRVRMMRMQNKIQRLYHNRKGCNTKSARSVCALWLTTSYYDLSLPLALSWLTGSTLAGFFGNNRPID